MEIDYIWVVLILVFIAILALLVREILKSTKKYEIVPKEADPLEDIAEEPTMQSEEWVTPEEEKNDGNKQ